MRFEEATGIRRRNLSRQESRAFPARADEAFCTSFIMSSSLPQSGVNVQEMDLHALLPACILVYLSKMLGQLLQLLILPTSCLLASWRIAAVFSPHTHA